MKRTTILVPPGIGDGYWVLVKLRGFLRQHGIQNPTIYVQDSAPRRSHGMWMRVPFVTWGGYAELPKARASKVFARRAYRLPGYAVQRRVLGFDWFLSFNGSLDAGRSLDDALPGPANWYEPMHDAALTGTHAAAYRQRFGRYVLCAFWEHGGYQKWLVPFGEDRITETLRLLADAGLTVVVMGAAWDRGAIADRLAAADPRFTGLVGETNFDELCGLVAGSAAVLGFPAGNTLLGPYFRRPTTLLWHNHYHRAMWRNSVPPDARDYHALDVVQATPGSVADRVLGAEPARAA